MNTFEIDCDEAIGHLKVAFIELYDSLGADPWKPQEVLRSYKLNKTLTWKISKLVQSPSGLAAVAHVPGVSAIEKMLSSIEKQNANPQAVAAVREASKKFEKMIEIHVGDRATLDLVIDGLRSNGSLGLEQSSKRAFWGSAGIYGAQSKCFMKSFFFCPNAEDPDKLDIAVIRGCVGMRRIRSEVSIPLFNARLWQQSGIPYENCGWTPLREGTDSAFLEEYSDTFHADIEPIEFEDSIDYAIKSGPIGNRSSFDCFNAEKARLFGSRCCTKDESVGEVCLKTTHPTENIILDLIVHEDLIDFLSAEAVVYAHMYTRSEREGFWNPKSVLPIGVRPFKLAGRPPAIATPLIPRYSELSSLVYSQMGWDPAQFRGIRLKLKYPPIGSTTVLRYALLKK